MKPTKPAMSAFGRLGVGDKFRFTYDFGSPRTAVFTITSVAPMPQGVRASDFPRLTPLTPDEEAKLLSRPDATNGALDRALKRLSKTLPAAAHGFFIGRTSRTPPITMMAVSCKHGGNGDQVVAPFAFPSLEELLAAADAALARKHPRQADIRADWVSYVVIPTESASETDRIAADDHIKLWDDLEHGERAEDRACRARPGPRACQRVPPSTDTHRRVCAHQDGWTGQGRLG